MKRTAILITLIIGFSGIATATNGQTDQMYRDITDMSDLITTIQGELDNCVEGKPICEELYGSAAEMEELTNSSEKKLDRGNTEAAMEDLKQVRSLVRNDIKTLEENDVSDDKNLSRVLQLEYNLEKETNQALKRGNTIGLVSIARECPDRCGAAVSDKAQEAKDLNSSRSNKPRS